MSVFMIYFHQYLTFTLNSLLAIKMHKVFRKNNSFLPDKEIRVSASGSWVMSLGVQILSMHIVLRKSSAHNKMLNK
jgi:hypothetical protein